MPSNRDGFKCARPNNFTTGLKFWDLVWGPVHTNPFSNKNGAVLLRFQNNLRPHLSFSYRFPLPHYNAVSVLKTLLYLHCACSNELDACAFQYIGPRNWRGIEGTLWRLSAILDTYGRVVWRPVMSILMTSPFSDSIKKFRQWIYFCFQKEYEMFFFSKWKQRESSLKVLLH